MSDKIDLKPSILIDFSESIRVPKINLPATKTPKSTLTRTPTLNIEEIVEGKNKLELIQDTLSNFGLSGLVIENNDSIKHYYDNMIRNIKEYSYFIGTFEGPDEVLNFTRIKSSGERLTNQFIFKEELKVGGYNKISIYTDASSNEYIIRKSKSKDEQFESFYENIKHIILYILIRKYIGNIKFIPQPYHLVILIPGR